MKSKTFKNRTKRRVDLIYDHMVFHTKYNRNVLVNTIRQRCEEHIKMVLNELRCDCVELNIQPNHVHILVGIPLSISPSMVTLRVKGISSYRLRREFPILVAQSSKALWSPSCVHTSVGNDLTRVIYYIQNQDKKHGGRY